MKDLKKRTITAIVLIAVLIPTIFFSSIPFFIACGIFTLAAAWELERIFKEENKWSAYNIIAIVLNGILYILTLLFLISKQYLYILLSIVLVSLVVLILKLINKDLKLKNVFNTVLYPSIGFASFAYIRSVETGLFKEGLFLLLYLMLICIATDTFAYFFGCRFGKHKLAPKISPKKSWEGSIAGTIGALIIPTAFVFLTKLNTFLFGPMPLVLQIIFCSVLSVILSIIDEIGDLYASSIKRRFDVKDYSQIFPGHGGILDRFDSYLFVSFTLTLYVSIILIFV